MDKEADKNGLWNYIGQMYECRSYVNRREWLSRDKDKYKVIDCGNKKSRNKTRDNGAYKARTQPLGLDIAVNIYGYQVEEEKIGIAGWEDHGRRKEGRKAEDSSVPAVNYGRKGYGYKVENGACVLNNKCKDVTCPANMECDFDNDILIFWVA